MPFIDSKISVKVSDEKKEIIKAKLGEVVHTLVLFKLALCRTQLGVDFLQSGIDEFLSLQRNLVLVGIGLTVVTDGQLLQVVVGTLSAVVVDSELCDRCHLGGGLYRESPGIPRGYQLG